MIAESAHVRSVLVVAVLEPRILNATKDDHDLGTRESGRIKVPLKSATGSGAKCQSVHLDDTPDAHVDCHQLRTHNLAEDELIIEVHPFFLLESAYQSVGVASALRVSIKFMHLAGISAFCQ
jgi:hypothetical protein